MNSWMLYITWQKDVGHISLPTYIAKRIFYYMTRSFFGCCNFRLTSYNIYMLNLQI